MRIDSTISRYSRGGVTLPEMLVAVSITVAMLLLTGIIFKSATDASGKAIAHNDIMQQLRLLTLQLERDFAGLRPDMPIAVVFEEDRWFDTNGDGNIDRSDKSVRLDRITFFANGDFQTLQGDVSGNVARVFYGQSYEPYHTPTEDEYPDTAPRRVLTRRQKVLTADDTTAWGNIPPDGNLWAGSSYVIYDSCPIEVTNKTFWKNQDADDYEDYYFNDNYNDDAVASMIRRPSIDDIYQLGTLEGLQQVYLLPDVSNFQIDVWFGGNAGMYSNTWMPLESDWEDYGAPYWDVDTNDDRFAFHWNTPPVPALDDFYDEPGGMWPQGLRFTFTLHDRNRRHYPQGLTFSYIVRLPERQ